MTVELLLNHNHINILGCKLFLEGDIISWKNINWKLIGRKKISEKQTLDLEEEVCKPTNTTIYFIPLMRSNQPWGFHTCRKFSGRQLTYDTKEEFNALTKYFSASKFMKSDCSTQEADNPSYLIRINFGTSDEEEEGIWKHVHNSKQIDYLNWLPNRPYVGSQAYNCLTFWGDYIPSNTTYSEPQHSAMVADYVCSEPYNCAACLVTNNRRKIYVRGLCQSSMFNSEYLFNINDDGKVLYLGTTTSFIIFDKAKLEWLWYDKKENSSVAKSTSTEDSLLLGVNTFDFSGVNADSCKKIGESMLKMITFTTCSDTQFTCNDGQCIDMEERCDQSVNCIDESDEDNCKMIFKKDNYKKTIAPFRIQFEIIRN
ncbi:uncharacterized protein LOC111712596 [Eurytemora carolleeae]|uniref:uncharacterized protein LOC111712596 n=1 Tax=Eurytemora carolleeae TaxID=1294199 RepID=UPI000C77A820|nr:uncharacterized protein LOC111712596 [Eurytemora carolleeae]|eukprot:XP_023343018.1 uncharacterized protein LOC111712596 [Eurytemora affinis]